MKKPLKKSKKQPKFNMAWASSANLVTFSTIAIRDNALTEQFCHECLNVLVQRGHLIVNIVDVVNDSAEWDLPAEEQAKLDRYLGVTAQGKIFAKIWKNKKVVPQ